MMKNFKLIFVLCCCCCIQILSAQSIINGSVKDAETSEPLIGASILVEGRMVGTTTDLDGNFTLVTSDNPVFHLEISLVGYEMRRIEIIANDQEVHMTLEQASVQGQEVVVSASRVKESILRSPVTIERMNVLEIRSTPSASAYAALANLKGVQMSTSSLTFSSINTRGFADIQNWRFVQLVDGMEMNAPGLNYPAGALSAPSDIEVSSIELVPGAGSALYGANAFNGMLNIYTKNPFYYQGLSLELKGGGTFQSAGGANPFGELDIRYAKAFKDKFAISISASAFMAKDWTADSEEYHITNEAVLAKAADQLGLLPRNHPNFNAIHRYGDEIQVPVHLGGGVIEKINRSGIAEADIVDYNQQVFKANLGLHYRITDDIELSYNFRMAHGDAILRHTTTYPLVNLFHQLHKLELKGDNFFARAYYSGENGGDTYFMLGTGAFIQEGLKNSTQWSLDYGAAFRGEVSGVTGASHDEARVYADRDIAEKDSELFKQLREATLSNPSVVTGGSQLVDRTSFVHAEVNYDISKHWKLIPIQIGGSFRRYNLISEGWLFNDGPNGFDKPIGILEYGAYIQASKSLFKDILSIQASARLDKNQNFAFRVTPRASAVISWGEKRNHNFRMSFQTGFRNPGTQETYIALDVSQAILLGGVEDNINNYNYVLPSINPITTAPAGTVIPGERIFDNLFTLSSAFKFGQTFNPADLVPLEVKHLKQEEITTFEAGYKSLISNKLFIDVNGYYNIYKNFVTRVNGFNLETNRVFGIYTNVEEQITSIGAGLGLDYVLPLNFKIGANYSFAMFNADDAIAAHPEFIPSFNTPQHRVNVSFSNRNVWEGLGFNIKYRWTDKYLWQSPFGQGEIPMNHVVDAAVFYRIPNFPMQIKVGAANITNQEYVQVYGGPRVGTQAFISISYDPIAYKGVRKGSRSIKIKDKPNKSVKEKPIKAKKPKKGKKEKEEKVKDVDNKAPGHQRF
ncbi:MAG: TonB-dependent receptor [Aureispira sp.]|nr:TonB-dependent receptor [Aureispira sp.]